MDEKTHSLPESASATEARPTASNHQITACAFALLASPLWFGVSGCDREPAVESEVSRSDALVVPAKITLSPEAVPVEREVDHHGEQPLSVDLKLTAQAGLSISVGNLQQKAVVAAWAVQMLDVEGKDVSAPIVGKPLALPSQASDAAQVVAKLPALPSGYVRVVATARVGQAGQGDEIIEGDDQLFLRVDASGPHEVTFDEWYYNSGAEQLGGPV